MTTTPDLRDRERHDEPVDALDAPLDALDAARASGTGLGLGALFGWLWRFFINMRTGLWLILILGLMSLAGTLLPQASDAVRADPTAYEMFLKDTQDTFGGWSKVFDPIGFFHVFSTWYFQGLTLLLCVSILACSLNRAPRLWKVARHPRLHMGETFFSHAPLHADIVLPENPAAATDHIEGVLKKHHFRVTRDDLEGGSDIYADRFRWGPFGTVFAHVSFVLLVIGFVATAMYGFKEEGFNVPVGKSVPVGHGTGLTVTATSFTDTYYEDGSPKDYYADIILSKNGTQVAQQRIRVNDPLRYDGVTFHQASFGKAQAMTVKDAAGKTLFDGAAALQFSSSDGVYDIGSFTVPGTDKTVYVVVPASGQVDDKIKPGEVQLEIHQAGAQDPTDVQVVSQGKPATIGGLVYTYERPLKYTGLIVRHDPGALLVWLGSAFFVAGLVLVFFFPHRRIWLRVRPTEGGSELQTASTMKRDNAFEPQFHQLMSEIQLAGTPASPQK